MGVVLLILVIVVLAAIVFAVWNRSCRRGHVLLTRPQRPDERPVRRGVAVMTLPLLRGRDVVGSPVVSIASGDDLAEVRDVVFDPNQGAITGFTLNQRGRFKGRLRALLPIDTVAAVGTDAVMAATDDALVDRDDVPAAVSAARQEDDVLHDLVVTESGRQLGTIQDVVLLGGPSPRWWASRSAVATSAPGSSLSASSRACRAPR